MMRHASHRRAASISLAALCACAPRAGTTGATAEPVNTAAAATSRPLVVREGFVAPEAVRYDPEQDVYFVSNWGTGSAGARDDNGFISRMRPDGSVESLRFIAGGAGGVTLHAPRGMTIVGDTLWVADANAVRGFDRRSGAPLAAVDFSGGDPGFLNDVAAGPDGAVYVTDTGRNRIHGVRGGPTVALADTALGSPNGITWDAANARFIVVPFGGARDIRAWRPGSTTVESIGTSTGARYDGVEVLTGGRILVASQRDTSLHLFADGRGRPIIRTGGPPADIAVDTRRNRVAVPIVALNRVELWELPR
ncbi:MAG: SMP-30/gluconolactonase/LRE family protein [Gemmatirosa sp.]